VLRRLWSKAVRSGPRCDLLSEMSRHQWGLCRAREGDAPFTTPISAAAAPSEHLSATSVPGTLGTELEASSEEMIGEAEEGGEAQATDRTKVSCGSSAGGRGVRRLHLQC